jgi:hypothetical protein
VLLGTPLGNTLGTYWESDDQNMPPPPPENLGSFGKEDHLLQCVTHDKIMCWKRADHVLSFMAFTSRPNNLRVFGYFNSFGGRGGDNRSFLPFDRNFVSK